MGEYIGWKLKVNPQENKRVQKHAFHFGYKWGKYDRAGYIIQRVNHPSIFIKIDGKRIMSVPYSFHPQRDYKTYKTIFVKDFLKLTL